MEDSELRVAAGAYVAGELNDEEQRRFETLLVGDEDLAREVAFWRDCRQELSRSGRPEANLPGSGFAAAVRQRLEVEGRASRPPLRLDAWRWAGWAAAAACLALLIGQWSPASTAWYDEQGNAVIPLSSGDGIHDVAFRPDHDPEVKAWLGLSGLRPTPLPPELREAAGKDRGLVVFRVEGPAAAAGIMPGDIVLNVAQCPTFSRVCVRHAMEQGDNKHVPVRFWSMREGAIREVMIDPGERWE